ncbi:hypothetical protein [Actinophytocola oryzae]|nr:hypothetical protein [Actinophytocola oryzae]
MMRQPPRDSVAADELAAYDNVVARQASYGYATGQPGYEKARPADQMAGPYFGALLQSPLIAAHISDLGAIYRSRGEVPGSYSHADREWIDIVLGHEMGLNMWGHVADGMAVGVRPQAVIAVVSGSWDDLEPRERMLAEFIRAFATGKVTDEQWATLVEDLGQRGAVEWTAFIGHLTMTIRLIQAFIHNEGEADDVVLARVQEVIDGKRDLPDSRARVPSPTTVS